LCNIFFKEFNFFPYGLLAVIAAITTQPVRLWSMLWVARHRVKKVAIISLFRLIIAVSLTLILIVFFDKGLDGRIIGLLFGNLFIFSISIYYLFQFTEFKFSLKILRSTLILGFPLVFSVFAYVLNETVDKYMIENILGAYSLGIYDLAYTFAAIPLLIMIGFSQVWQPVFYENMQKGLVNELNKISELYLVVFFSICMFVIIFSNEIFYFFVNESFYQSIILVPIIVLGIFFLGLANLIASVFTYYKKFKQLGFISFFIAMINIFLNYFFISAHGMFGAAIATSLSMLIFFLFLYFKSKQFDSFGISFKKIFLSIILLLLIFIIIKFSHLSFPVFKFNIFIIKLIFVLIYTFFLFKKYNLKVSNLLNLVK